VGYAVTEGNCSVDSQVFSALLGQERAVALLTAAVRGDRLAPAYWFAGPAGVGRRLAARCFAELVFSAGGGDPIAIARRLAAGNHPDLLWVEPTFNHQGNLIPASQAEAQGLKRKTPPQVRLEQIRDIGRFLSRPPLEADRYLVVVEDAETMAESAANALLKTLEEPGRATLILIAPGDSLLPTLVSRCQKIPFMALDPVSFTQIVSQTEAAPLLQDPSLVALSQGSPGEACRHWRMLQLIPEAIVTAGMPRSAQEVFERSSQLTKTLDLEAQLWLLDYLQYRDWIQGVDRRSSSGGNPADRLSRLEEAKRQLLRYVQPQLVWEVLWLGLAGLV
jgi:DNA polymerase III subunit delta'